MEWPNSKLLLLIELYKQKPRLWDPTNGEYKIKSKKNDDWIEISKILGCDLVETKKKMDSLLASFRRERHRQDGKKSGSGRDGVYVTKWFAYSAMNFLLEKFSTRVARNTDVEYVHISEEEDEETGNNSDDQTITPIPNALQKEKKLFKSPPKKKQKKPVVVNQMADQAYQIMQDTSKKRNSRDNCTIFGEHVACKLRQYDRFTQNYVQHLMNNILFDADMGKYGQPPRFASQPISISQDSPSPSSVSSTNSPSMKPACSFPTVSPSHRISNLYATDLNNSYYILQQYDEKPGNEILSEPTNSRVLRSTVVKPQDAEEIEDPLRTVLNNV